ncbi:MAG: hypothetical protein ACREJU_13140 [Nitrospiraceae bacterium]
MSGRLFNLLPAVYRLRDSAQGDPLRALLAVIEREVDRVEGDIARLYDNWFIETCDEWVVPYIGDLLGVRGLLTAKGGTFSRRGYVANTLAYRRGKGTATVLEQLARDLTGWPARAVEFFERLATTQHVNHVRLDAPATVDIRSAYAMQLVSTPFEIATHTAEVRHIDNARGAYNIPYVGLFLWRLQSYVLTDVTARKVDAKRFTFDPLGGNLPLFNVPETETGLTHLAEPINVPMPLSRLRLHHDLERYYGSEEEVDSLLLKVGAAAQTTSQIVACDLSDAGGGDWAHDAPAGKIAVDPQLGRIAFADAPSDDVGVSFAYGFGGDLGGGPYDRRASLTDALKAGTTWQVGVMRNPPPSQTQIKSTLTDAVKEWNQQAPGARGMIVLMDSRTYEEDLTTAQTRINIPASSRLIIAAAQWPEEETDDPLQPKARVTGRLVPKGVRPHLKGTIEITGTAPTNSATLGRLILNGLLIEGDLSVVAGNLGDLQVAHCTLPPDATTFTCKSNPDLAVAFTRSICGDLKPGRSARSLHLVDCLVDGGIEARALTIESSTIFGKTNAQTLEASNAIFVDRVQVERRQVGCVRFSYLPLESQAPRRFQCQPADDTAAETIVPQFGSTTLGEPSYGMLATTCPPEIGSGAEDEGEMGAWHFLHAPQRVRNLRLALNEYLRFGLEAGIFFAPQ